MKITILHGVTQAKPASGLTMVIDVFRASSVVCYLFGAGAKKIVDRRKISDSVFSLINLISCPFLFGRRGFSN
jgi:2-phosphosulfolactate phosphatase